ncbi:uncharacterized protein TNCV_4314401 [Trichonephila clavipes]|nr:uncharacterized protein TNCV_4314401 [Trichonephila clavipes]
MQFSITSEDNGWTEGVKACQITSSLRGEASEILQTLPDTERLNLNSLYNALDLRFSQKYSKDDACLQMKTPENRRKFAGLCLRSRKGRQLGCLRPPSNHARNNLITVFCGRSERGRNSEGYKGDGEIERENAKHKGWNFEPRETQLQLLGMWCNGTPEKKLSPSKEGRELFFETGKLIYGYLAGRWFPGNEAPHHKILQITAVNGGDK